MPAAVADLIHQRGIHGDAVVVARVEIVVALVRPAELEQVIAMQQRKVVAIRLVVAVPRALTRTRGVDVIRDQRVGGFATDLDRAAQSGKLRRASDAATMTSSCE